MDNPDLRAAKLGVYFWNNPLIVSAFRLRFRRGGVSAFLTIYALALGTAGALLMYYQAYLPRPWAVIYLTGILGLQAVISAVGSMFGVQGSMQLEVVQRTWDFQRITGLSPTQLLIGKMLGASADSYLSIFATIPFSVWAWSFGAASGVEIALIYVLLFTTTILFGAIGLLHPLDLAPGKDLGGAPASKNNARSGLMVVSMIFLPQLLFNARSIAQNPWLSPFIGLLLPALPIVGLFTDDAWAFGWELPGITVPYLLISPWCQLIVAGWLFQIMRRRIIYLHCTTISKLSCYCALLAIDAVLIVSMWGQDLVRIEPNLSYAVFWATHTATGLLLLLMATPSRVTLMSWLWHFRDRPSAWRDYVFGERTENTTSIFVIWLLGLAVSMSTLILLPRALGSAPQAGLDVPLDTPSSIAGAAGQIVRSIEGIESQIPLEVALPAISLVTLAFFGILYQFLVLLANRGGWWAFAAIGSLVTIPPQIVGYFYGDRLPALAWLSISISPTAHFSKWLGYQPDFGSGIGTSLLLYIILYVVAAVMLFLMFRRQMRYYYRDIQGKLDKMLGAGESAAA